MKIEEALNKHYGSLKQRHPDILNVGLSTKWIGGENTGAPSITVYVKKKLPQHLLAEGEKVPEVLEGFPTDVIEFDAPWIGHTSISELTPEEQRKRLGLSPNYTPPKPNPRAVKPKTPSGQSDLTAHAQPIQDQITCGSCLAFDFVAVIEGNIHIATGVFVKLSESDLFRCSGGTCDGGSNPDMLTPKAILGICTEDCLPYQPVDAGCGVRRCTDWWVNARHVKAVNPISDLTEILSLLDTEPLAATMPVHQSFLSYTGPGIYKNLGSSDPIIGYHGVGAWGYGSPNYKIGRNQWGLGWGQNVVINGVARPGWFLIDSGELDTVMYELPIDNSPVPPQPTPTPQCQTDADCQPGYQCVNNVCVPIQPPPIPGPTATFLPTSGKVGTVVTVMGKLWMPSEIITKVDIGGKNSFNENVVYDLMVTPSEELSGTITIPSLTPEVVDIAITGSKSGRVVFPGAFTVTQCCASRVAQSIKERVKGIIGPIKLALHNDN